MSNIVKLFENDQEYKKQMRVCGINAVEQIWQDPDVLKALKEKVLEHISSMSQFDMTYETGFKNMVMPSIFSDETVREKLREKFIEYINQDDINYDLGEALHYVLEKKLSL